MYDLQDNLYHLLFFPTFPFYMPHTFSLLYSYSHLIFISQFLPPHPPKPSWISIKFKFKSEHDLEIGAGGKYRIEEDWEEKKAIENWRNLKNKKKFSSISWWWKRKTGEIKKFELQSLWGYRVKKTKENLRLIIFSDSHSWQRSFLILDHHQTDACF